MSWYETYFSPYKSKAIVNQIWQRELHPKRGESLAQEVINPMLAELLNSPGFQLRVYNEVEGISVVTSSPTLLADYYRLIHRSGIGIEGVPIGMVPHKKGNMTVEVVDTIVDQWINLSVRKLVPLQDINRFSLEEQALAYNLAVSLAGDPYWSKFATTIEGVGSELLTAVGAESDHDLIILANDSVTDTVEFNQANLRLIYILDAVAKESKAPINFLFYHQWDEEADTYEHTTISYA